MKQLPGEIKDRLTRRPSAKNILNKTDASDVAETESVMTDGGQGSPDYLPSPESKEDEGEELSESGETDNGKGNQIDFEV